jgi:hypothetical protein
LSKEWQNILEKKKKKNTGEESMSTITCKFPLPMPTCLVRVVFLKHLQRDQGKKIPYKSSPLLDVGSVLTPPEEWGHSPK